MSEELTKFIMGNMYAKLVSRPMGRDDHDVAIHASQVYDLCTRRHILSKAYNTRVIDKRQMSLASAITFGIGRKVQEIITEVFEDGMLVGVWECPSCNNTHFGLKPKECGKCKSKVLEFEELPLQLQVGKFAITGSVDLPIFLPHEQKTFLNECKSIKPEEYDNLSEPKIDHYYQIQTYLWLAKKLKSNPMLKKYNIQHNKGSVIYVCKLQRPMPLKIFEVTPDEVVHKLLNNTVRELKAFSNTMAIPKRVCQNKMHIMARSCGIMDLCFRK